MDNYRSISLLSFPGKCQEQHRFIKGRSIATQLILKHKCTKALDAGHQVDVVFVDFSKAFY